MAITSFDDYNGCGCLFQFDVITPVCKCQMHYEDYGAENYYSMDMRTKILYRIVNAMPDYIKSRLITFPCYCSSPPNSKATLILNHKLALRSEGEIVDPEDKNYHGIIEGEQIGYYRNKSNRIKSNAAGKKVAWWTRTPSMVNKYCYVRYQDGEIETVDVNKIVNGIYINNSEAEYWLSPFGCL
jgi:hypothetical protein